MQISQPDQALKVLKARGIVRLNELMAAGVAQETVARLVRSGHRSPDLRGASTSFQRAIPKRLTIFQARSEGSDLPCLGAAIPRTHCAASPHDLDGD